MRTIIIGPPGTGKTTTLLNKVDEYLKNTHPSRIGYFSFTKKAANEARDRAIEKFKLDADDFPYFRTLHSFAFRELNIKKDDVMQARHYKDLGEKMGIAVNYAVYEDDNNGLFTSDSEYLRIINLARLRDITAEQQYNFNEHHGDIELDKLNDIEQAINIYKKEYNLIDYNDMIVKFIESDKCPNFEVVFIDEAQDLSLIQWKMVRKIEKNSKNSFIAGDDDQGIYRWAGADVDSFITLEGEYLKLKQSYRIPLQVHNSAMNIISRVGTRIPKTWNPKDYEGKVTNYDNFESIDMSKGKWLILARTNYMLKEIEYYLDMQGLYYKSRNNKNRMHTLYKSVKDWDDLRNGAMIHYKNLKKIFDMMTEQHVDKNKIKSLLKDSCYDIDTLKKEYGLKTSAEWQEAFDDLGADETYKLDRLINNNEDLDGEPRIKLSTIHGAKGGEEDNVVLLTDLSVNTLKSYEKNPDDEHRLFYVGATRTKEHLHIVSPKNFNKGYEI